MTLPSETATAVRENDRKPASFTSTFKVERWRTLHKHAGLMQFIPSRQYYARCKVRGKSVRASLETDVFTSAKSRLVDKIKKLKQPKAESDTVADGCLKNEAETAKDHTLAPLSKT